MKSCFKKSLFIAALILTSSLTFHPSQSFAGPKEEEFARYIQQLAEQIARSVIAANQEVIDAGVTPQMVEKITANFTSDELTRVKLYANTPSEQTTQEQENLTSAGTQGMVDPQLTETLSDTAANLAPEEDAQTGSGNELLEASTNQEIVAALRLRYLALFAQSKSGKPEFTLAQFMSIVYEYGSILINPGHRLGTTPSADGKSISAYINGTPYFNEQITNTLTALLARAPHLKEPFLVDESALAAASLIGDPDSSIRTLAIRIAKELAKNTNADIARQGNNSLRDIFNTDTDALDTVNDMVEREKSIAESKTNSERNINQEALSLVNWITTPLATATETTEGHLSAIPAGVYADHQRWLISELRQLVTQQNPRLTSEVLERVRNQINFYVISPQGVKANSEIDTAMQTLRSSIQQREAANQRELGFEALISHLTNEIAGTYITSRPEYIKAGITPETVSLFIDEFTAPGTPAITDETFNVFIEQKYTFFLGSQYFEESRFTAQDLRRVFSIINSSRTTQGFLLKAIAGDDRMGNTNGSEYFNSMIEQTLNQLFMVSELLDTLPPSIDISVLVAATNIGDPTKSILVRKAIRVAITLASNQNQETGAIGQKVLANIFGIDTGAFEAVKAMADRERIIEANKGDEQLIPKPVSRVRQPVNRPITGLVANRRGMIRAGEAAGQEMIELTTEMIEEALAMPPYVALTQDNLDREAQELTQWLTTPLANTSKSGEGYLSVVPAGVYADHYKRLSSRLRELLNSNGTTLSDGIRDQVIKQISNFVTNEIQNPEYSPDELSVAKINGATAIVGRISRMLSAQEGELTTESLSDGEIQAITANIEELRTNILNLTKVIIDLSKDFEFFDGAEIEPIKLLREKITKEAEFDKLFQDLQNEYDTAIQEVERKVQRIADESAAKQANGAEATTGETTSPSTPTVPALGDGETPTTANINVDLTSLKSAIKLLIKKSIEYGIPVDSADKNKLLIAAYTLAQQHDPAFILPELEQMRENIKSRVESAGGAFSFKGMLRGLLEAALNPKKWFSEKLRSLTQRSTTGKSIFSGARNEATTGIGVYDLGILRGYRAVQQVEIRNGIAENVDAAMVQFRTSATKLGLAIPFGVGDADIKKEIIALVAEKGLTDSRVWLVITGGESSDGKTVKKPLFYIVPEEPSSESANAKGSYTEIIQPGEPTPATQNGKGPFCYFQGKIIPVSEARLSPSDKGILEGQAVFDFFTTYDNKPFKLKEHLDRLRASAATKELQVPMTDEEIEQKINELIRLDEYTRSQVRIFLTGGTNASGPVFYILVEEAKPLNPDLYKNGAKVVTIDEIRKEPTSAKHNDYAVSIRIWNELGEKTDVVEIVYAPDGKVLEASTSNLFIVKDGKLITTKDNILNGVTRKVVLELARAQGYQIDEREITLTELLAADEVFITASNKEVLPVVKVNDQIIANGQVGAKTKEIMGLFRNSTQPTKQGNGGGGGIRGGVETPADSQSATATIIEGSGRVTLPSSGAVTARAGNEPQVQKRTNEVKNQITKGAKPGKPGAEGKGEDAARKGRNEGPTEGRK